MSLLSLSILINLSLENKIINFFFLYGLVLCCFYNLSFLKFDRHDHYELYGKELHEHSSQILPLISTKEKQHTGLEWHEGE